MNTLYSVKQGIIFFAVIVFYLCLFVHYLYNFIAFQGFACLNLELMKGIFAQIGVDQSDNIGISAKLRYRRRTSVQTHKLRKTFYKLHVLGMNDDMWDKARGLGSETWKGC